MTAKINPLAGKTADPSQLANIPRLVTAYFAGKPDPSIAAQRVAFGTSGHRGSAFNNAFNEAHILAISQALCDVRRASGLNGPLFVGIDTHALAEPALASALEVFAANGVEVMVDAHDGYTPTPVISHAILTTNKGRTHGLADGVVITPSHNPPEDGGFKYNPPNGGPADTDITAGIERAANGYLEDGLRGIKRIPYERARKSSCVHSYDYIGPYVADLVNVVDMDAIRAAGVKIGIDPLGGAAVRYWQPIIERYGLAATIVSDAVDPTFRFMTLDWDGKIRMDCSSPFAMARLIGMRDKFDVAFANDTDADRHGIVTRSNGLMNPNHYLAVTIAYLFGHRPQWGADCAVGKTIVSSAIIDRVANKLGRRLVETPVGIQMVCRRPRRRLVRVRRRGKRRRVVPEEGRVGVDHRQGRHHSGVARRRDDRANQTRSGPVVRSIDWGTRQALLRADRRACDAGAEESPEGALARKARDERAGRRAGAGGAHRGTRQRSVLRRHQGLLRQRLVCRAAFGHRRRLQDLCGEFPQRGTPAANPARRPVRDRAGLQRLEHHPIG